MSYSIATNDNDIGRQEKHVTTGELSRQARK